MIYSDFAIDLVVRQMAELWNKKSTPKKLSAVLLQAIEIIQQLRRKAAPQPNAPLTLDELRKMGGEPVWLHTFSSAQKKTNVAQWAIVETVGNANATFLRAGINSRLTKWFANYGNTWLAYLRKPEEGEP